MRFLLTFFLFQISLATSAQDILGQWKTIDDNTGKPRSIVEVYEKDGQYYGKIVKLFREPHEDPDPICDACNDHREGEKVIGMEIITGMEKSKDAYEDGEILDPENGKVYRCKLWVEDGNLKVRGYLYFLYRTQTWMPYSES